ncbi:MAG: hypothetical protein CL677_00005, partial [Bdellovibrionaceae bacterium]|nr:hypothetical protein [Pseudobdellovibrionaceae bacterium]
MTSKKLFATYFIFFIFIYIMYLAFYYPQITTEPVEYPETRQLYDYRGVTHTHSSLSSGSGNIDDIAAAAQAAELDFIYITDLNDFDRSSKNKEGVYGNLLLFVAGEYTYLDSKFLNYHNTTNEHLSSVGRIQLGFSELLEQKNRPLDKGIFVLSHPLKPGYKWDGNIPEGMDGIEVINLKSQWQQWWEASKTSFLFTSLLYPINGRLAFIRLLQRPIKNIRLWDQ